MRLKALVSEALAKKEASWEIKYKALEGGFKMMQTQFQALIQEKAKLLKEAAANAEEMEVLRKSAKQNE
jgi:hypothetical protein